MSQNQNQAKPTKEKSDKSKSDDTSQVKQSTLNKPSENDSLGKNRVTNVSATVVAKKDAKSVRVAGRTMKERGATDDKTYRNNNK